MKAGKALRRRKWGLLPRRERGGGALWVALLARVHFFVCFCIEDSSLDVPVSASFCLVRLIGGRQRYAGNVILRFKRGNSSIVSVVRQRGQHRAPPLLSSFMRAKADSE